MPYLQTPAERLRRRQNIERTTADARTLTDLIIAVLEGMMPVPASNVQMNPPIQNANPPVQNANPPIQNANPPIQRANPAPINDDAPERIIVNNVPAIVDNNPPPANDENLQVLAQTALALASASPQPALVAPGPAANFTPINSGANVQAPRPVNYVTREFARLQDDHPVKNWSKMTPEAILDSIDLKQNEFPHVRVEGKMPQPPFAETKKPSAASAIYTLIAAAGPLDLRTIDRLMKVFFGIVQLKEQTIRRALTSVNCFYRTTDGKAWRLGNIGEAPRDKAPGGKGGNTKRKHPGNDDEDKKDNDTPPAAASPFKKIKIADLLEQSTGAATSANSASAPPAPKNNDTPPASASPPKRARITIADLLEQSTGATTSANTAYAPPAANNNDNAIAGSSNSAKAPAKIKIVFFSSFKGERPKGRAALARLAITASTTAPTSQPQQAPLSTQTDEDDDRMEVDDEEEEEEEN